MNVKKITINNEEDLEPYCSEKHLENRTKILVKQNNEYLQYLIGVIVKYDQYLNIHIRYLDNPLSNNYWWFNGEKPGVDPNIYSIFKYKDLLNDIDMEHDGNDDIINLKKDNIYSIVNIYPYYNGKYGNVYSIRYFKELFNENIEYISSEFNKIPPNIEKEIGYKCKRIKIKKLNEIIPNIDLNDEQLKRFISYKLNKKVKYNIQNYENIKLDIIEKIKNEFKNNLEKTFDFDIYLKIISYIFKIKYIIYSYLEYNIQFKIIGNEHDNIVYLYQIKNILYIINNDSYEYKKNRIEC